MPRVLSRRAVWILAAVAVGGTTLLGCYTCTRCSPSSAPPASDEKKELAGRLEAAVRFLAEDVGPRSYLTPKSLEQAATWIEKRLKAMTEGRSSYATLESPAIYPFSTTYRNIVLTVAGSEAPEEVVVVGAHYDSDAFESGGVNPGADDNATGVAALLVLAQRFAEKRPKRTMKFVAFSNDEEPFFKTHEMGSRVYARELLATPTPGTSSATAVTVVAMVSLEMLGYFTDAPCSQDWWPLLPSQGNFIAFVSNWSGTSLTRQMADVFCAATSFPTEMVVGPRWLYGIGWSDHWSFWKEGVPAFMVTDTALARNYCYHQGCDVPGRLDFNKMAIVVDGVDAVLGALANEKDPF